MHEAWFLTSHGFASCGQEEIAFLLEKRIIEDVFPYEMLKVFRTLYSLILNQGELNVSDQLSFISSYYLPISISTLLPLTFSAMSTNPHHLRISSFHNVSDLLSFISSYYMSIPSQPCFPHLLCNVYHLTSSDLFIP